MYTECATSYHSPEVLAGLFVEAVGFQSTDIFTLFLLFFDGFFLGTHLCVDLNIEFEEVVDGILVEFFFIPISFV